jgi:hypothetical protein
MQKHKESCQLQNKKWHQIDRCREKVNKTNNQFER